MTGTHSEEAEVRPRMQKGQQQHTVCKEGRHRNAQSHQSALIGVRQQLKFNHLSIALQ